MSLQHAQMFALIADNLIGAGMPSVNAFGGCDPKVEIRLVDGNPDNLEEGGVHEAPAPGMAVETEVAEGSHDPKWPGQLELKQVSLGPRWYVQAILWDWNPTVSTALGDKSVQLLKVVEGLTYSGRAKPEPNRFLWTLRNLFDAGSSETSTLECSFSFVPIFKYRVHVLRAQRVPSVNSSGNPDGFIEVRIVRKDPAKHPFELVPGEACIWSAKTRVVNNSTHPKWDDVLECNAAGFSDTWLQLLLWTQGLSTPLGHHVVHLAEVNALPPGLDPMPHLVKISQVPGADSTLDISKVQLRFSVGHDMVFDR